MSSDTGLIREIGLMLHWGHIKGSDLLKDDSEACISLTLAISRCEAFSTSSFRIHKRMHTHTHTHICVHRQACDLRTSRIFFLPNIGAV